MVEKPNHGIVETNHGALECVGMDVEALISKKKKKWCYNYPIIRW